MPQAAAIPLSAQTTSSTWSTEARVELVSRFGENLRRQRERHDHTMRSLADTAGMNSSEICRLEAGQREPRLSTIVRLARALEISPHRLLKGID